MYIYYSPILAKKYPFLIPDDTYQKTFAQRFDFQKKYFTFDAGAWKTFQTRTALTRIWRLSNVMVRCNSHHD